jgi:hypothetical protein
MNQKRKKSTLGWVLHVDPFRSIDRIRLPKQGATCYEFLVIAIAGSLCHECCHGGVKVMNPGMQAIRIYPSNAHPKNMCHLFDSRSLLREIMAS